MGKSGRKSIWDTSAQETAAAEPAAPGWGSDRASAQPPAAVPVVEQLRVVEKKRRDRSWEKQADNRPMLFRRVPPGLCNAIKEVAGDLQVRVDDVARAFLEFGLDCYQKGDLEIRPVLSDGRLTLFPKADNRWGKSSIPGWYEKVWDQQAPAKKTRKSQQATARKEQPWKWQVSYRGIPGEVQDAIREIHRKKSVPLGEVATLLLGHSLEAYRAGQLVLTPQPRQAAGVTTTTR